MTIGRSWTGARDRILSPGVRLRRSASGSGSISYLSPLLAIIVGIIHASVAPVIVIGDVKPNLLLVAVVLVTSMGGFLPGITWAFVGGLTVNLLVGEPLGSVPLALLVVAALVAGGQRLIGRQVWAYPIAAAFAGSIVADVIAVGLGGLVSDAPIGSLPTDVLVAAALLNAGTCAILVLPARLIAGRYVPDEAAAW